jgi:hypothetical protein
MTHPDGTETRDMTLWEVVLLITLCVVIGAIVALCAGAWA